jgi:DNA replication licensing factor MCM3
MENPENDISVDQIKRQFLDFLESERLEGKYIEKIKSCLSDGRYVEFSLTHRVAKLTSIYLSFRLIVNINDLRNYDQPMAEALMKRPRKYMIALQEATEELAKHSDPSASKLLKTRNIHVGFEGSFGRNSVSPRGMLSGMLNSLVEVEGIVTKCSDVRPKVVKSVHFCPETNSFIDREYRDHTSLDIGIEVDGKMRRVTSSVIPSKDNEGRPIELEYGLSEFKDNQTLIIQEMPERARVGQLPRSVQVILEHDLVNRVKPGDRVRCVGVYRPLPNNQSGQSSAVFRSLLIANNIAIIGREIGAVRLTGRDVENIRAVCNREDILDILAASLCPSIYGHEFVKKALILQLLGGCEKNLANGTHLRGDINVLLVGDPSTAKSQLLRAIMDIAPLAISTTGRGSSGVGLTAAVTSDSETGERRLEAGAMVLADRGIVCVDEFDKMGENDRVAIHEVMEQQTVTIAKAGIHASLNARCSVLGAANPVYGQYDRQRRPQENIGLPDSLISRFDLLFIILDQLDASFDRLLSEHVITSHQYRRPGTIMEPEPLNQMSAISLEDPSERLQDAIVWLRGGPQAIRSARSVQDPNQAADVFTKEFLRRYIHFAKNRMHPELSDEAMDAISIAYADMRAKQTKRNLPVTARSLETIIRLSSASAKVRLSDTVTTADVDAAIELLNYCLYHEVGDMSHHHASGSSSQAPTTHPPSSSSHTTAAASNENLPPIQALSHNDNDDEDEDLALHKRARTSQSQSLMPSSSYAEDRAVKVKQAIQALSSLSDEISVRDIVAHLNREASSKEDKYALDGDIRSILQSLEAQNKVRLPRFSSPSLV